MSKSQVSLQREAIDSETWETVKSRLVIARGDNDLLYDEAGAPFIDLFSGNGTVWLGHANKRVRRRISEQLDRVWITGGLETRSRAEAASAIERLFPDSFRLAGLYSTGMEAAEFALRFARVVTGRTDVVGFAQSMHGKSLATAYLGWDNSDGVRLPQFHRLPFVSTHAEEEILDRLRSTLLSHPVSAVFVEPLQGSGGGHAASDEFYQEVYRLCREAGTLLIFDEILTGFYRTGVSFYFERLGFCPDVVLVGKAMGNGFPVSGVVVDGHHKIAPRMLPGSTYAGNPLAGAAIAGTLDELSRIQPLEKVAAIEGIIAAALSPVKNLGLNLRGRGAMWVIELPPGANLERIALGLYHKGLVVSFSGRILRLLPAVTIAPDRLAAACETVREYLTTTYAN